MGLLNRQVGVPVVIRLPPKLDGYVVVGGTWKPKNTTKNRPHQDESEEIFNIGFYGPGAQVDCQLLQKVQIPPVADLQVSQVITEVATPDNPMPGSWVVMKADPTEFGTTGIVFDCTLQREDAMDLTQVTPA